jgi:hypothetical protein
MNELQVSTQNELIELTNAFRNICEGINQMKSNQMSFGVVPDNFMTVSGNLLKLINIKTSLLVTECLRVEPLA